MIFLIFIGKHDDAVNTVRKLVDISDILLDLNWYDKGGDEIFVGRAGFMCAVLWMQKELNMSVRKFILI